MCIRNETIENSGDNMTVEDTSGNTRVPRYQPPWNTPYIIGIGGTSGSGKTSVASQIVTAINVPWTVLLSLDNFYKPLTPEEGKAAFENKYDFDNPRAIDMDLAYHCLRSLKEGKCFEVPVYSFVNHNRVPGKSIRIYGASVIILEGIYALQDVRILDLMNLKIYVDADLDVCLARRLSRDIVERGRDLDGCLSQWERFVKPNAVKYVRPTMRNADVVVPSMSDNRVAVEYLVSHIRSKLRAKSYEHVKELNLLEGTDLTPLDENPRVHKMHKTPQVLALITMLLDKTVCREDFIFYFDRLSTILLSKVLENIPLEGHTEIVTASNNAMANSAMINFDKVAAVDLIRSGDCFIHSLRKTLPNVPIGKLLIQSDSYTGEPQLHCEFLPRGINKFKKVMLLETQIISGASMVMAIQVLLDHGVSVSCIDVVVFTATEQGLRRILNAFDGKVNVYVAILVTTEQLHNGNKEWCLSRFVERLYFGCP
ncbi:uridine kinase URK1 KNAG_0D00550 [Huiozyma naganishii CBS 8797]|uniref:Uridine kinase n=1 Tax=Huiozyma naganishii (strain ATCC MYA-139 / BCRC 22969 / CBS 8797 / KCTC 17520 / NBRC 10181 / NCYC 3082 / Yp74L-3) TaxID=1071383 RepID=J7RXJ4_HUIN7|nr:hypothetical protein KNAG_0D00550 [Kazachstania naganishii CBS 8797]CCK69807.1 hypothetical protein KNAG_0D00550 [Kazachstania naganishii CBS 8797]